MEFSYALILRKAAWAIVLTIGLAVAYYGSDVILHEARHLTYPPMVAMMPKAEAPKPAPATESQAPPVAVATAESNVAKNRVGVVQPKPILAPPETYPIVTAAGAPPKDWTEYGDKIVGWLVALAGAYKLIQKAPVPAEAPVAERKPRFIRKKK